MDYGQELRFGLFPTPAADRADEILALAEVAEVSGVDLVTVQDHPYQAGFLDAWTLLSAIAARSTAIRVALNVGNLPLRPPVVLGKSTASLDLLTGGRVELGIGAGGFVDPIVAAGGPRRTPGESVEALEEAIEIIRGVWREPGSGPVSLRGKHYQVAGLHPGPAPAHPVEIWVGALKPRMLRLVGRRADGWLPSMGYAPPAQLPEMNATIDAAAVAAGRDPAGIRRLYNVGGRFGTALSNSGGRTGQEKILAGSPRDWAKRLAELTLTHGMSTFILASDDPADVRRFGEEVAPAVRDLVDAGRAGGARVTPARAGDDTHTVESEREGAGGSGTPLHVHPTPEPAPVSDQAAWDESTRPVFPAPATFSYTERQQSAPQHLIDVHDGLRAELERLRDIVEQVASGAMQVGDARSAINRMTLRQNAWTLGAYCEQYCRMVTGHHALEDVSVFPHLRRVSGAGPVIDRLTEEHEVIAELLDHLDRALVGLVEAQPDTDGAALGRLRDVLDLVTDALLSHLSYEERELFHPLAQVGFY